MTASEFKERILLLFSTPLCDVEKKIDEMSVELFGDPREWEDPKRESCRQCKGRGFIESQQGKFNLDEYRGEV